MLRSVSACRAVEQKEGWSMSKAKWEPTSTACLGAGQGRYVVVNQEIDAVQTRDLRLFKG